MMGVLALAGCASLPGEGPNVGDITMNNDASAEDITARDFAVIELSAEVIRVVGSEPDINIGSIVGRHVHGPGTARIGVGDRLTVRIWESPAVGLFSDSDSSEIPVVVNAAGEIYIPYVGNLQVVGLSTDTVRQRIAEKLEGRAVDPEVIVILENNGAQSISVVGDARSPGRFDIPGSGLRLLDAVAVAGGARAPGYDTEIRLIRGERVANVLLENLVQDASNNVWLAPGDTIQLFSEPRSFAAFGAVSSGKQQTFDSASVNLAEALAQVGGLNDRVADKGGVFVFRFESASRVQAAGGRIPVHGYQQGVPTIYQLDFSTARAFFLAQSFMIRDKDILYVAPAPAADFRKFISLIVAPILNIGNATRDLNE